MKEKAKKLLTVLTGITLTVLSMLLMIYVIVPQTNVTPALDLHYMIVVMVFPFALMLSGGLTCFFMVLVKEDHDVEKVNQK